MKCFVWGGRMMGMTPAHWKRNRHVQVCAYADAEREWVKIISEGAADFDSLLDAAEAVALIDCMILALRDMRFDVAPDEAYQEGALAQRVETRASIDRLLLSIPKGAT